MVQKKMVKVEQESVREQVIRLSHRDWVSVWAVMGNPPKPTARLAAAQARYHTMLRETDANISSTSTSKT
jgi:uncharacterized protein (DUF1778 family)